MYPAAYVPPSYAAIGFTVPAAIYDQMRELQANAVALDACVDHYVADPITKASWKAWYASWFDLYSKYAGPNASTTAKLGVLLQTDELAKRVESYHQQLTSWFQDYATMKQANGQPVPASCPGPAPNLGLPAPSPFEHGAAGLELPWWVWTLVGAGVVGGGYYAYRRWAARRGHAT
jgi:hypothetical protein